MKACLLGGKWARHSDASDAEAPPTVGSGRTEACESDSVDEHLPLLLPWVHKQSGFALGIHLKQLAAQEAVLHSGVRLTEGGPCHQHRTRHPYEAENNQQSIYVKGSDKKNNNTFLRKSRNTCRTITKPNWPGLLLIATSCDRNTQQNICAAQSPRGQRKDLREI